jgi:hypothetical protein
VSTPASVITNSFVFAPATTVSGSPNSLVAPTSVGGVRVSSYVELQGTTGGFLLSRMATTQRDALTAVNGLALYNSTTDTLDVYANNAWQSLVVSGGDETLGSLVIDPSGYLRFMNSGGTQYTQFIAGANAANLTLTLPITDATANASASASYVPYASNTAGVLSFPNQLIRYSEMTLSAANIAAMFANGVEVIPAPGANLAIIVHRMEYQQFFLTAQYTGGGNVYLNYGTLGAGTNYATTSNGIPGAFVTGVAANSSLISVDGTINSTTGLTVGSVANAPVCITNASAAFAAGSGTARVKVWYSIVSTA